MATLKHLKNAPITEAVVDIRIKELDGSNIDLLSAVAEEYTAAYPTKRVMHRKLFSLQVDDAVAGEDSAIYGYRFESDNRQKIVQVRLDGFTLSYLRPYSNWMALVSDAKELYEYYQAIVKPEFVSRIALRYINQIKIPLPLADFSEYLTAPPTIPEKLPQGLLGFLTQNVVEFSGEGAIAKVTQGLEDITNPDNITILLDIDVFRSEEFVPNSDVIWETFERLHNLKNKIFFESLTEKTMRLFE